MKKYINSILLFIFSITCFTLGQYTLPLIPLFHWARDVVIMITGLFWLLSLTGAGVLAIVAYHKMENV